MSQGGRYEFSAVAVGGVVVVAGGKQPRPKGLNPRTIDVFDPKVMRWRNGSHTLQASRFFAGGAAAVGAPAPMRGPFAIFAGGTRYETALDTMDTVEFVRVEDL